MLRRGLGDSKVDDFRDRPAAILVLDQHIGGLQVAMYQSALVRMSYAGKHIATDLEPLAVTQLAFIAVTGDRGSGDKLHYEKTVCRLR